MSNVVTIDIDDIAEVFEEGAGGGTLSCHQHRA